MVMVIIAVITIIFRAREEIHKITRAQRGSAIDKPSPERAVHFRFTLVYGG